MGFYLNEPSDYFTDIEEAMSNALGRIYMTSPREWDLMSKWEARVPLHIVLGAIKECCKGSVRSLAYCEKVVEQRYDEWKRSQVGKSTLPDVEVKCLTCNDTREVTRKPVDAEFDWQLEFVPCEECK